MALFQTLSNIYCGESYSESCVAPYLKPWHIQNQRHIHNIVQHLSWHILFKFLCNLDLLRTLLHSTLCFTLKKKHIQNPTEYLRWSILLRTLCNCSIFRRPIYSKFVYSEREFVSYSLIHFMPLVSFYTSWKHQKISGFLMFLGGIERDQWHAMG